MRSYVSPLQRLTTAAERGDTEGVPLLASQLKARTIRLTNIAESAAETLKPDTELAKYVIMLSGDCRIVGNFCVTVFFVE